MSLSDIISLFGGVALFLFGMSLMGDGLKKAAGNKLELVLYRLSKTPLRGIILGTGVTAVIQSSAATSVMVVGFVNSGLVQLTQAVGIIMGSFIGTAVTGWVICLSSLGGGGLVSLFSTATLTGLIAVAGVILRMFCKGDTKKHIGDIMLGFAVLMYGISGMSAAAAPLKESAAFVNIITRFSNPLLGFAAGIAVTVLLQSASSSVGLLQTLAVTGVIDFTIAFPMLLGMAVGASAPVLISSVGARSDARRAAASYLVISLLGAVIVGGSLYVLNIFLDFSFMTAGSFIMSAASIALVNTLFRLIAVLLLAPFAGSLAGLLKRLISDDPGALSYVIPPLEERFLANPALALDHTRKALFSMADVVKENLLLSMKLLLNFTEEGFRSVEEAEDIADRYEDRLGTYLIKVNAKELSPDQTAEVSKYLHAIGDLERISDHAVNISECAREIFEKKIIFSEDGSRELEVLGEAIADILDMSIRALTENDVELASKVEPLEELIDDLSDELKLLHVERLQRGECTLADGFVFNDLISNYERVSDHCSNLAVAVIELDTAGAFDTHEYLGKVKELHSGQFDELYARYAARYRI